MRICCVITITTGQIEIFGAWGSEAPQASVFDRMAKPGKKLQGKHNAVAKSKAKSTPKGKAKCAAKAASSSKPALPDKAKAKTVKKKNGSKKALLTGMTSMMLGLATFGFRESVCRVARTAHAVSWTR